MSQQLISHSSSVGYNFATVPGPDFEGTEEKFRYAGGVGRGVSYPGEIGIWRGNLTRRGGFLSGLFLKTLFCQSSNVNIDWIIWR